MLLLILFGITSCIIWAYWISSKYHNYWTERGVPQTKPLPLLGDSAWGIIKKMSSLEVFKKIYETFPGKRYAGAYQFLTPVLVLRDPELIKQVLVKDFDHFVDHVTTVSEDHEPIWGRNIFALKGLKWRLMRTTLSPFFTSRKMRTMFIDSIECADKYTDQLKIEAGPMIEVEAKDLIQRFSNDVMVLSAFGVKCDSLKNKNNELFKAGMSAFGFETPWKNIKFFLILMAPKIATTLRLSFFPKQVRNFFLKFIKDIVKTREERNIIREDLIHLLMEAKKGRIANYEEIKDNLSEGFATVDESDASKIKMEMAVPLSDYDLLAQALVFHLAGFDTVAILISFLLHEVTINQVIQKKLQNEIDEAYKKCHGKLTYEILMEMKYVDMVVSETLRKYPPAFVLDRKCVKKYTIEPTNPDETPLEINPGDQIWVPVSGIHWDTKYYKNPEKFDPERFSKERKDNINPYTYIPFGAGPRNCIGSRFALLQTKIFLFYLYLKFNSIPIAKTQIPIKLSTKHIQVHAEKGCWIGLQPRPYD